MKFCPRPFNYLYVRPDGDITMCGWNDMVIGNILKEDLYKIWNGKKAQQVRQSIINESYTYCRCVSCPYLENDSLEELDKEQIKELTQVIEDPVEFNLAYDFTCNHSCPSCRNQIFLPNEEYKENLKKIADILTPYLNKAKFINICGNGDVFSSPYLMNLLKNINPKDRNLIMSYETNGVLFDEDHWKELEHLHKYETNITVTPNSFNRSIYKYLCGGHDNLDKLLNNLMYIKSLREKEIINKFDISIVVQDRNYRELPSFIEKCIEDFNVDTIVVKPIYRWFELSEEEYWFKDILNPLHPYNKEYMEILNEPICKDDRVYYWGADNLHQCVEYPSMRFFNSFYILADLFNTENMQEKFEKVINKYSYNKIAIYGASHIGKALYNTIKKFDISINFFIDKYSELGYIGNLEIKNIMEFEVDEVDIIIVTPNYDIEIIESDLRKIGFCGKIIHIREIVSELKKM